MERVTLDLPEGSSMRLRMENEYARMGRYAIARYRQWLTEGKDEDFDKLMEEIGEGLYRHIFGKD